MIAGNIHDHVIDVTPILVGERIKEADTIHLNRPAKRTGEPSSVRSRLSDVDDASDPCVALVLDHPLKVGDHIAAKLIDLRHWNKRSGFVRPSQIFKTKASLPEPCKAAANGVFDGGQILCGDEWTTQLAPDLRRFA